MSDNAEKPNPMTVGFIPAADGSAMVLIVPADGGPGISARLSVMDVRQLMVDFYRTATYGLPTEQILEVHNAMADVANEELAKRLAQSQAAEQSQAGVVLH